MSSSQMQEIMEMPREFIKDGTQFINRCTYVVSSSFLPPAVPSLALLVLL
jgi:protein transport protein SEC61 subunit gamma-like protein